MNPETLNLNQLNSPRVQQNGWYESVQVSPVTVYDGDTVTLRLVSLDSQKADTNTIVIPEDLNLGITFSYYDYDYTTRNKTSYDVNNAANNYIGQTWATEAGGPTFNYYAMYTKTPIVTFSTANCTIVGGFKAGYNAGLNLPVSGTFLMSKAKAAERKINLPDDLTFLVTVQYIDPDGNYQQAELTGNNATFGSVPGSANTTQVYYANALTFPITKASGGTFTYQKGTIGVVGVTGFYPGKKGTYKGEQTVLETLSGSLVPNRTGRESFPTINTSVDLPQFKFTFDESTSVAATDHQLKINTQNGIFKAASYDPNGLTVEMNQFWNSVGDLYPQGGANDRGPLMGVNQLMTMTSLGNNVESIFRLLDFTTATTEVTFNQGKTYQYQDNAVGYAYIPTYVGASKFIIDYGQGGGQVFSVSYKHMPLQCDQANAPANPPIEAVAYIAVRTGANEGGVPIIHHQPVLAASGIAIHQLEPRSFWEDTLGLYSKLIVPLYTAANGNTKQFYLKTDLEKTITYGFDARQGLLPASGTSNDWRSAPITAANYAYTWIDTEGATQAIVGETLQARSSGYYLVEVTGLTPKDTGYQDGRTVNGSIIAVVSTQYDSDNQITGFQASGIPYVHRGEPFTISRTVTRILDPGTSQVSTNLGENNSVIVDITRSTNNES